MENLLGVYLTSHLIIYPPKGSQKLPEEQVIRLAKVCRVCNKPGTGESFSISLTQPLSVPRVLNCRIITPSLREHSEGQSIAIIILFIKSIVKVLFLPWENVLKHSLFPRQ